MQTLEQTRITGGDEEHLASTLANLLGVRPPKDVPNTFASGTIVRVGQLWPAGDTSRWTNAAIVALMDAARHGGSENWIKLALANGVLAKQPGADALAIAWLTELKTKRGWDGNEVGCRNDYWWMHRIADLVFVRAGSAELAALAWESLDLFRFWAWTGAPLVGQRSVVPGREQHNLADETMDYLRNAGPLPAVQPPTFDRLLLATVGQELVALSKRSIANPKWAMATGVTLFVAPGDAMVVVDANVDANTLAGLAARRKITASWDSVQWAPAPPWGVVKSDGTVERIREQGDGGRCAVSGGVALYTSRIFKSVSIPLPPSAGRFVLGSGSTKAAGAEPVAASPTAPPPAASVPPPSSLKTAATGGCLLAPLLALRRLFGR